MMTIGVSALYIGLPNTPPADNGSLSVKNRQNEPPVNWLLADPTACVQHPMNMMEQGGRTPLVDINQPDESPESASRTRMEQGIFLFLLTITAGEVKWGEKIAFSNTP